MIMLRKVLKKQFLSKLIFILTLTIIGRLIISPSDQSEHTENPLNYQPATNSPLILIWTKCDYIRRTFENCPSNLTPEENACNITTDKNLLNRSTAVIFCIEWFKQWSGVPPYRHPDQYYIFATTESPLIVEKLTHLRLNERRNFFNLTMTYRLDSDVPYVYGRFGKLDTDMSIKAPIDLDADKRLQRIIHGKSKLCAWIASHCRSPSGRERFVGYLSRYISIDTYGKCGNLSCSRSPKDQSRICEELLETNYKFYLAFENSVCRDYVSEKVYKILGRIRIVPIVLERRIVLDAIEDEETRRVFDKSFIAVSDFDYNARKLADYLKYLDRNVSAYLEYFEWRKTHWVLDDGAKLKPGCQLCSIIREGKKRVVEDVYQWYTVDAHCRRPRKRFSYDRDW